MTGFRRVLVLVFALILILAEIALAQTLADTLRNWGLLGTWAVDCSRPASSSNGYLTYVVRLGKVSHEREFGDRRDSHPVLSATRKTDGSLELLINFTGVSQTRQFSLIKGSDGRIRAMFSRNTNTDEYSIREGKLVASGAPSPWQSRCR